MGEPVYRQSLFTLYSNQQSLGTVGCHAMPARLLRPTGAAAWRSEHKQAGHRGGQDRQPASGPAHPGGSADGDRSSPYVAEESAPAPSRQASMPAGLPPKRALRQLHAMQMPQPQAGAGRIRPLSLSVCLGALPSKGKRTKQVKRNQEILLFRSTK